MRHVTLRAMRAVALRALAMRTMMPLMLLLSPHMLPADTAATAYRYRIDCLRAPFTPPDIAR